MPAHSSAEVELAWSRAIEFERLRESGRATVRVGAKQLALFLHDGAVLSLDWLVREPEEPRGRWR